MITQQQFRTNFEVADKRIFFNHAAYSPLSKPVVQSMNDFFEHRQQGNPAAWAIAEEYVEGLRENYSRLVGASQDRIAHMANTVTGVNVLANGLDWKSGDHILLYADEFPSNVMPFLNLSSQGVEVELLSAPDGRVTPELFEAAIRPQTKLISVSSVQYLTGYRADLKSISDLCHSKGILFAVDAIQSIGLIPTDVINLGVDFMAVGGHKWMMSPLGTGFLYLTEELQSRLKLVYRGYMGHENPIDFGNFDQKLSSDARRFELGAFNAGGMVGAEKATGLLLDCGLENISQHVLNLNKQFEEGISDLPYEPLYHFSAEERSGIFMFTHHDASKHKAIFEGLTAAKVNLSLRGVGLRIAPHYYNTPDEVEQLLDLLKGLA